MERPVPEWGVGHRPWPSMFQHDVSARTAALGAVNGELTTLVATNFRIEKEQGIELEFDVRARSRKSRVRSVVSELKGSIRSR
jgi:hypothetical protein